MTRVKGPWLLAAGLALVASMAVAQSPADAVVQQLREQGYLEFAVSRTLLGRVRVVALAPDGTQREIVFNPATGEILRDYSEAADGSATPRILSRPETQDEAPGRSEGDDPRAASSPPKDGSVGGAPQPDEDGGGGGAPRPDEDNGNHGHGNDEDGSDSDNPGQGHGNDGTPGGGNPSPGGGSNGNPSRGGGNGKGQD